MPLSRLATEFAHEIKHHDWSDAPYRADRAGHRREDDRGWEAKKRLTERETDIVRTNVMWVVGQVLGHAGQFEVDDVWDWAEACGVTTTAARGMKRNNIIKYGFRLDGDRFQGPRTVPPLPDDMFIPMTEWGELHYVDVTHVDFEAAALLVKTWLAQTNIDQNVTAGQMRGALGSESRCYVQNHDYVSENAEPTIEVGGLREWFYGYYARNYAPRRKKKASEITWADLQNDEETPF